MAGQTSAGQFSPSAQIGWIGRHWFARPSKDQFPRIFLGINYCSTYLQWALMRKWWLYVDLHIQTQGGTMCRPWNFISRIVLCPPACSKWPAVFYAIVLADIFWRKYDERCSESAWPSNGSLLLRRSKNQKFLSGSKWNIMCWQFTFYF